MGISERADRDSCPECGRWKQVAQSLCCHCRPKRQRADIVRNCAECSRLFSPYLDAYRAGRGQYCSQTCAARAGLRYAFKPRKKVCTECGCRFVAEHALRKRCSDACEKTAYQAKHQHPLLLEICHCQMCGAEFVVKKLRGRKHYICSLECYRAFQRSEHQRNYCSRKGKAAAANPFITKGCPICGQSFEVNFLAARRLYCSPGCAARAERRRRLMIGGTTYYLGRDTPEEFWKTCQVLRQLRQLVAERTK